MSKNYPVQKLPIHSSLCKQPQATKLYKQSIYNAFDFLLRKLNSQNGNSRKGYFTLNSA